MSLIFDHKHFLFIIGFLVNLSVIFAQNVQDDFEGNGTITTWFGDNCDINTSFINPFQINGNQSSNVLRYNDTGGQFANVRFDISSNFDLTQNNSFSIKIYVPSSGLTGTQPNQVSLKLQNNRLSQPYMTQSEIIKPLELDQWQTVTFDFENDNFINLDPNSPPPITRNDFNRVLIQVNGENNNDHVLAFIDDIEYFNTVTNDPIYNNLVWSDEFEGNGAIDINRWHHQTLFPVGDCWFNDEIQHYTDRTDNSNVSNGTLKITAKRETFTDQGVTKQFTSARLNSKFAFTYGRVEVRAKLPTGVGTWPAIWMLGQNINEFGAYWQTQGYGTTSWPACGEIDIMEHWGDNQDFVQSAMHTPSSFGNTINRGGRVINGVSDDFHIYTLDWFRDRMVFRVDGIIHYTYEPNVQDGATWPFDEPQYLLLNVAMLPNVTSDFSESSMEVDYIRVFQESTLSVDNIDNLSIGKLLENPVSDVMRIRLNSNASNVLGVSIVDLRGRLIMNKEVDVINEQISVDIQALQEGLYLVKVSNTNGAVSTFKLIKR